MIGFIEEFQNKFEEEMNEDDNTEEESSWNNINECTL